MSALKMSAPAAFISVREFARRDGCDDKLVRRAIKSGKLPADDAGKLDPGLVGTGWRKTNRRGADTADTSKNVRTKSVRTVRSVRTKGAAPSAPEVSADDDVEKVTSELFAEEAEDFLTNVLNGNYAITGEAERVKENALAAKHLLAARQAAGSLIDIEIARRVLFDGQRAQRDSWINFPAKIGPMLAAELGVEAEKVVEMLSGHVHQQLSDLGDPEADFSE